MKKKLQVFLIILTNFIFLCNAKNKNVEKDWTFIVYLAGDNDLKFFAGRNIKEMERIGSTPEINVLIQLDGQGAKEKTKRLFVEKGSATQVNKDHISSTQKLDFGNPKTLIDCCEWAFTEYPARHYMLVLWNHGTGILDNIGGRASNASELFNFNTETNMLEINRGVEYLEYLKEKQSRGICFNDTYGTYLTNQKLKYALTEAIKFLPDNRKIDIIGFDACLMAMVEMGNLLQPFAHYMVGSQELELGTGWPYHEVLKPFLSKSLTPEEFAKHIVQVYHNNYKSITYDYTLSASDLTRLTNFELSFNETLQLLLSALKHQTNNTVTRLLRASKSKRLCTYFSEPSYIDLHHFLSNISEALDFITLESSHAKIKKELQVKLFETIENLEKTVIANICGKNLERARGLSIYFPTRQIEPSYLSLPFLKACDWLSLIQKML